MFGQYVDRHIGYRQAVHTDPSASLGGTGGEGVDADARPVPTVPDLDVHALPGHPCAPGDVASHLGRPARPQRMAVSIPHPTVDPRCPLKGNHQ